MNREIKFQGKRLYNGEWATGFLLYDFQESYRSQGHDDVPPRTYQILDLNGNRYTIKHETVGQYINRKDDNLIEIYEGHIVDVVDGADGLISEMKAGRYKVVYSQVDCAFILEQIDGKNGIAFDELMSLTIVGNIHDNPELLTQ